jgi:two-component system nitrate/nitrite response regulator NarL
MPPILGPRQPGRIDEIPGPRPRLSKIGDIPDAVIAAACDHLGVAPQTVLIVDDHAGFRRLARRLLEAGGFDVVGEADDGASALVAVDELRPELVLLDVVLPDTDGFAVAELLSAAGAGPVVVLTSSREATDFGRRLTRSPARGFIHKDELSAPALARVASGAS